MEQLASYRSSVQAGDIRAASSSLAAAFGNASLKPADVRAINNQLGLTLDTQVEEELAAGASGSLE